MSSGPDRRAGYHGRLSSLCRTLEECMRVAIVIPCYKETRHILAVLAAFDETVDAIYVVDDACPDQTGELVRRECSDPRVKVIIQETNTGVGGAVLTGYRRALADGMEVIVKVDGDGQMDPRLIPALVKPILEGKADYCKGSRFHRIESLKQMPLPRILGNAVVSFMNKAASGYWNIMDPTNGFTAIHRNALLRVPLDKIAQDYFFESDMLFRLGTLRAVVRDMPMDALYGDETSHIRVSKVVFRFPWMYFKSFCKRLFYSYLFRDFNAASLQMLAGFALMTFGLIWGIVQWSAASSAGVPATTGTVMLAVLPIILGFQLMLSAIQFDMNNVPTDPIQHVPISQLSLQPEATDQPDPSQPSDPDD